jgi:hypothetical protein
LPSAAVQSAPMGLNRNDWIAEIKSLARRGAPLRELDLDLKSPQFTYGRWRICPEHQRSFRTVVLKWLGPPHALPGPPAGARLCPKSDRAKGWNYRATLGPPGLKRLLKLLSRGSLDRHHRLVRTFKHRYELAEEILQRGGTNEEIQHRIMEAFPNSKENITRAQWYRRSFQRYGHCRGDSKPNRAASTGNQQRHNSNASQAVQKTGSLIDVDARLEDLEKRYRDRNDVYVAKQVRRLIRSDRQLVTALKEKYGCRCQFPKCRAKIPMLGGGSYCEVAHLQPAACGGEATRVNLVVLCPNHHKMIDYGELIMENATRKEIIGTLNGKRFRINR